MRSLDKALQRWRARMVRPWIPAGAQILDIGCHQGEFLKSLGERIGPSVGLDPLALPETAPRYRLLPELFKPPTAFTDGSFDAITIGYGLRYPPDLRGFLAGVSRLLRPGGRFLSLDFGLPQNRAYRSIALAYLLVFGSAWGLALHGRPGTYAHIVESLRAYPMQYGTSELRYLGPRGNVNLHAYGRHGSCEIRWHGGKGQLPSDQSFAGTKIDLGGFNYLFTFGVRF